jgi:hypothetical protein
VFMWKCKSGIEQRELMWYSDSGRKACVALSLLVSSRDLCMCIYCLTKSE